MLIVMQMGASKHDIKSVEEEIKSMGYEAHPIYGVEHTVIGAIGDDRDKARLQVLETSPGVERVIPILRPYKLAGTELKKEKTKITVGDGVVFGGNSELAPLQRKRLFAEHFAPPPFEGAHVRIVIGCNLLKVGDAGNQSTGDAGTFAALFQHYF